MNDDLGNRQALGYLVDESNRFFPKRTYESSAHIEFSSNTVKGVLQEDFGGEDITLRELATELNDGTKIKDFSSKSGVGIVPLEKLIKSIATTAEDILNKSKLISSQSSEMALMNSVYKTDVCDLSPVAAGTHGTRTNDIIMVLGESGIGKTFFSMNEATELKYGENFDPEAKHVRVHINAISPGADTDDMTYNNKLVELVKKVIQHHASGTLEVWQPLNMRLSVIVDECGVNIKFFAHLQNIAHLYTSIKGLSGLEEGACRLILAGVGLDSATSNISSTRDVRKYRLKPWTRRHLKTAWANETYCENLLKAIDTEPVLLRLCSNGRVARHVKSVLLDSSWLRDGRVERSSMGLHYIVDSVCGEFMNENGLGKLDEKKRRVVAFLVLYELNRLCCDGVPSAFPDFSIDGTIERKDLIRCAQGMVHINVESQDGSIVRLDDSMPSIGISPSMTMLLYYMLGPRQQIASSWSSLETVCALSMIKQKVLYNGVKDLTMYKIARLRERVPEPGATKIFKIPHVDKDTVWINGDMAPFADIVGHFELRQSRFETESNGGPCKVDIRNELGKCGLLKLSETEDVVRTDHEYFKGQVVISCLWATWNSNVSQSALEPTTTDAGQEFRKEWSHLYPEILLNTPEVIDTVPMVKVKIVETNPEHDGNGKVERCDAAIEIEDVKVEFVKSFDEKNISFYFCTNKSDFQLSIPKDGNNKTVHITSRDVDREGTPKPETVDNDYFRFVQENVKEGVLIRFMFGSASLA